MYQDLVDRSKKLVKVNRGYLEAIIKIIEDATKGLDTTEGV